VLVALGVGLGLYVLPFWREGRLRPALWLTLVATLLHVYSSHKRASSAQQAEGREVAGGAAGTAKEKSA
jgi:hypothetical protein